MFRLKAFSLTFFSGDIPFKIVLCQGSLELSLQLQEIGILPKYFQCFLCALHFLFLILKLTSSCLKTMAIMLGVSTTFGGPWAERVGPRKTAAVAG